MWWNNHLAWFATNQQVFKALFIKPVNTGAMKKLLSKAEKPYFSIQRKIIYMYMNQYIFFHLEKDYLHVHESICNLHTLLTLTQTLYQSLVCQHSSSEACNLVRRLICCLWECILIGPFWRLCIKDLNIDPELSLLGVISKEVTNKVEKY